MVSVSVTKDDISVAMTMVQPSGMREVQLEIPQVLLQNVWNNESIIYNFKCTLQASVF